MYIYVSFDMSPRVSLISVSLYHSFIVRLIWHLFVRSKAAVPTPTHVCTSHELQVWWVTNSTYQYVIAVLFICAQTGSRASSQIFMNESRTPHVMSHELHIWWVTNSTPECVTNSRHNESHKLSALAAGWLFSSLTISMCWSLIVIPVAGCSVLQCVLQHVVAFCSVLQWRCSHLSQYEQWWRDSRDCRPFFSDHCICFFHRYYVFLRGLTVCVSCTMMLILQAPWASFLHTPLSVTSTRASNANRWCW